MNVLRRLHEDPTRHLRMLATVNVVIWIIAIIAMTLLMQDSQAVKKLAPILMAGTGAGVAVLSAIPRTKGSKP